MNCKIVEQDTGGKLSREFRANCDGKDVGKIRIVKTTVKGRRRWEVSSIFVDPSLHRKGIGTKLYEAAAQSACASRSSLVSTGRNPKAHSNDFWKKMLGKRKAHVIGSNAHGPIYEAACWAADDLSGARSKPRKTSKKRSGATSQRSRAR